MTILLMFLGDCYVIFLCLSTRGVFGSTTSFLVTLLSKVISVTLKQRVLVDTLNFNGLFAVQSLINFEFRSPSN